MKLRITLAFILISLTLMIFSSIHKNGEVSVNVDTSLVVFHGTLKHERLIPPIPNLVQDLTSISKEVLGNWEDISMEPKYWGETVPGVMNRLDTEEKVIALTFDACGGPYGSGYDEELINFLRKKNIPATLFVNTRWIETNMDIFLDLSGDPLFQIENHGTNHLPLSLKGATAWGIQGTTGVKEVIQEVMGNQELIYSITGKTPKYFRSGTAFYDEYAIKIVKDLGLTIVNYDILGDAGATFSSTQVKNALLKSESGSIALLHMNQPDSGTADGVKEAIPLLLEEGFSFVFLSDYDLKE